METSGRERQKLCLPPEIDGADRQDGLARDGQSEGGKGRRE